MNHISPTDSSHDIEKINSPAPIIELCCRFNVIIEHSKLGHCEDNISDTEDLIILVIQAA